MKNTKNQKQNDSFRTSKEVKEWCYKVTSVGACKEDKDWPKDLFKRDYFKIIEFLEKRFRNTQKMKEYYFCIPYLMQDIEPDELFIPWLKSNNFKRSRSKNKK
ncbi:hypothetical protein V7O66_03535 [Methanolobus sp. ZRKC3]|uniref:hypothetical protein n=1 Tax=Methanolobus sp. ZRKC3 TaxID=3125786 RepID=UPI00324F6E19